MRRYVTAARGMGLSEMVEQLVYSLAPPPDEHGRVDPCNAWKDQVRSVLPQLPCRRYSIRMERQAANELSNL